MSLQSKVLRTAGNRTLKNTFMLLLGLIAASTCHARSSPCVEDPPNQKPVVYEVQDQQLWRHETETGKRTLVKGISDVQSVAQSALNCNQRFERKTEPNMVVVSKTDGTVWIRGVIWAYFAECPLEHCPDPKRMLNTRSQWKKISKFKDVRKVAAGETWVVGLTRFGQVFGWGTVDGSNGAMSTPEEYEQNVPLLEINVTPIFSFPAYRDVIAFGNAAYGLMVDGQVTAWGYGDTVCRVEAHRKMVELNYTCPFIYPAHGNVERIWQTPGNPQECNAAFVDGQLWQWPCDVLSTNTLLEKPIMPDRIRKGRLPAQPSSPVAPSS